MKKNNVKTFIDEIYSKLPKKKYPTNKIKINHIDEIWSTDLKDMSDYKVLNKKRFGYIFVIIDNFSKYTWCIPLKNKNDQIITDEFSKTLTTLKRKPNKIESDRGKEFNNSIFQNFLKINNIHHYSRFTHKGPSIAGRVIGSIRNLLKKPLFVTVNADWLSIILRHKEVEQYNPQFNKNDPIQTSKDK